MNAIHALSQLSYVPKFLVAGSEFKVPSRGIKNLSKMRMLVNPALRDRPLVLLPFEFRLSLFEEGRHTFFFVFRRKADSKQVDLTA